MPRGQDALPAKAGRVAVALLMALGAGAGGGLGACATGKPLEVKKVDAVAQPPSNVAVYMKITREDGQPVSLVATDFKVYEDGKQLPSKKVKRALLPVQYAVDRFVFVVVDLSGPLVDSEYLSTLQDAVASLADRIGKEARLGLSAFDGDGLVPFVRFDDDRRQGGVGGDEKVSPAQPEHRSVGHVHQRTGHPGHGKETVARPTPASDAHPGDRPARQGRPAFAQTRRWRGSRSRRPTFT